MGVSENRGTAKSSILIGFSIINHPFWGIPISGNSQMVSFTILRLRDYVHLRSMRSPLRSKLLSLHLENPVSLLLNMSPSSDLHPVRQKLGLASLSRGHQIFLSDGWKLIGSSPGDEGIISRTNSPAKRVIACGKTWGFQSHIISLMDFKAHSPHNDLYWGTPEIVIQAYSRIDIFAREICLLDKPKYPQKQFKHQKQTACYTTTSSLVKKKRCLQTPAILPALRESSWHFRENIRWQIGPPM